MLHRGRPGSRSAGKPAKAALLALGAFVAACSGDPELPSGWEGAERVAGLTQSSCSTSSLRDHDERATFAPGARRLDLTYSDAHFRCEQSVEGFYRDAGGKLDVLVQPVDMHPSSVARCDCLYEIDVVVDKLGSGSRTVTLFRRWDAKNEPNEPVAIGSASVAIE